MRRIDVDWDELEADRQSDRLPFGAIRLVVERTGRVDAPAAEVAARLRAAFPEPEFYLDEDQTLEAIDGAPRTRS